MPATLDERVVPWLPSRTRSVSGVGEEFPVDGVADPSFQRSECFLACLPFDLFALVIRVSGRVVRDLCDRGDVDRVVQLAVPARVEPVPYAWSGGRFDRGGAVVAGVVPRGWEASRVAAVADEVRGEDWSDAEHVGDCRRRRHNRGGDACFECDEVTVRVTNLGEELDCETSTFDPNRVGGTDPA